MNAWENQGLVAAQICDRIESYLRLASITFRASWPLSDEASAAWKKMEQFADLDRWRGERAQGFYAYSEEFSATWCLGSVDPIDFAMPVLLAVIDEAHAAADGISGIVSSPNHSLFAAWYGADAIGLLMAVVRDMVDSARLQHRRFETEIEGEDGATVRKVGPLDSDDVDFEEAGMYPCEADAEHATLITAADLNDDLMEALTTLISKRWAAANAALRGEISA